MINTILLLTTSGNHDTTIIGVGIGTFCWLFAEDIAKGIYSLFHKTKAPHKGKNKRRH